MEKRAIGPFWLITISFFKIDLKIQKEKMPEKTYFQVYKQLLLSALIGFSISLNSCRVESEKLDLSPGKALTFSADTFWFDTVFTDLKTPTLRVRVYNPNDKAVNVKSVYVNGIAGQYPFSFHINGRFGPTRVNDVLIEGKDSAYILVSAKLNPKNQDLPFIVKDSLVFEIEGRNDRPNVKILAYGQDAIYLRNTSVECNTTWSPDRPIILLDTVSVLAGCTLEILSGTKVYGYNSAFLIVRGTLIAQGTKEQPVTFQGTRLENYYSDIPGQWGGILIMNTGRADFNHVNVKNSFRGIQVGEVGFSDDRTKVATMLLRNSKIQNIVDYGVLGINSGILAVNNQFADCGEAAFAGLQGGIYELWHNTFGLSGNNPFQRDGKYQLIFANQLTEFAGPLQVKAVNNLITGTEEDEIAFGDRKGLEALRLDTLFFNNIIKSKQPQFFVNGKANKGNQKLPSDFRFLSAFKYYFAPDTNGNLPVFKTGLPLDTATSAIYPNENLRSILRSDINDENRNISPGIKPDVGAYINQTKKL